MRRGQPPRFTLTSVPSEPITPRPAFAVGQVITNNELSQFFGGREGGIRYRGSTRRRVQRMAIIQTSTGRHPYREQREGDLLTYMGQGRKGNQQMRGRNLALAQHIAQRFPLYAFLRVADDAYECLGPAVVEDVTEGRAPDDDGKDRLVFLFAIRLFPEAPPPHPTDFLPVATQPQTNQRRRRSSAALTEIRKYEIELAHTRTWTSRAVRSRALVDAMKRLYGYRCQLCGDDNPIPHIPTEGGRSYVEAITSGAFSRLPAAIRSTECR